MYDVPVGLFVSAFLVSASAGFASHLRSEQPITWVRVGSSVLNLGLLGLGVAFLWCYQFRENHYFLLGVCVLVGLGGQAGFDSVMNFFRRGGFGIRFDNEDKK